MATSFRILHIVGSLDRAWGGLSLYVAELAAQLAQQGHRVHVICQPNAGRDMWQSGEAEVGWLSPRSREWNSACETADVIHVHGLWLPFYHQALASARRRNQPHLLSIHGMLEPGALRFSRWKKRVALWLYQSQDLRRAPALHSTAQMEYRTLRALGLRQPIVTLPPGVWLPPLERKSSLVGPLRHALFLGRIHPKKGILPLIDAWATLQPAGWQLDLAGPDESNHLAEVRTRLQERRLEQQVIYHGSAFGQVKEKLLGEASLLIVPSVSENFGIVVAEGLAHGLPVITTTGTPWEVLVKEQCGWWVPTGGDHLLIALREAIARSPENLLEMGQRGRLLAEREFGWPRIARQMSQVYAWLNGNTAQPECLHKE